MYFTKYSKHFLLTIITFLTSLIFWLIFYFNVPQFLGFGRTNLETVFANYDGPNYMVIAKCGYNKDCIRNNFSLPQPLEYYPAHFPGYPALIKFFDTFTTGPKAMLFTTLIGSIFLSLIFFELSKLYVKEKTAFWLTIFFLFFPARVFVLRQVGAPETWFLATILASIFFFKKEKYLLSAIFVALAQTLKTPAVLLLVAYGIYALYELFKGKNFFEIVKKYYVYLLSPLTVLAIFYFYYLQTNDFFAYFNSGDNFHLNPYPYSAFISTKSWLGSIWLEDIVYIYLFALVAIMRLIKKYKFDIIVVFSIVFTIASMLVAHRDISRYISPVYPFIFIAFAKYINTKNAKIILLLIIPAIILFAINHVVGNTAPIADWTPYL